MFAELFLTEKIVLITLKSWTLIIHAHLFCATSIFLCKRKTFYKNNFSTTHQLSRKSCAKSNFINLLLFTHHVMCVWRKHVKIHTRSQSWLGCLKRKIGHKYLHILSWDSPPFLFFRTNDRQCRAKYYSWMIRIWWCREFLACQSSSPWFWVLNMSKIFMLISSFLCRVEETHTHVLDALHTRNDRHANYGFSCVLLSFRLLCHPHS